MLRIALIGAGAHSTHNHAPALRDYARQHAGRVELAVVCDRDPERAERARTDFGFSRACGRIEDLDDGGGIGAVVAIVPIDAALDVTRALLPRRIPLLIEKPLGSGIAQARALAAEVAASGVPVMVSLNRRFDPGLAAGLAWARERGPARCIHGTMKRHGRLEPEFVWGTGIHLIDALCHVTGPLRLRSCATPAGPGGCARTATLEGRHGEIVALEILPACGRVEERISLAGDNWSVDIWTGAVHPWRVRAYENAQVALDARAPDTEPLHVRNGTAAETDAFLDAVTGRRRFPAPTPSDALAASELAAELAGAGA
jgi:predicted dehydrogenase